jgi:1-deoxy-D-xylulose-5-phosphate synthase
MADEGFTAQVVRLGIPDRFIEHGTQDELRGNVDMIQIVYAAVIKKMLGEKSCRK